MYAQNRKIGKQNNLKVLGAIKPKGLISRKIKDEENILVLY
jgi:hypothetical protein